MTPFPERCFFCQRCVAPPSFPFDAASVKEWLELHGSFVRPAGTVGGRVVCKECCGELESLIGR